MLSQSEIKKILKKEKLQALKSLGQNFLIDKEVLDKIIQAAELGKNDVVLEIGPGLGVLTKKLSEKAKKVIAVEKDRGLAKFLEGRYRNVEVINGDALKLDFLPIVKKYSAAGKYKVVSNIPYYITSPLMKLFLESECQPKLIVFLVQKEVAQRICAKAGDMSILAISVQTYGSPEIAGYIDKSSFYPEPKVDSAILKIKNISRDFSRDYYQKFFKIVKMGFSAKRKKISNNLSSGLYIEKEKIKKFLESFGINPDSRAQELTLEDWKKLADLF